MSDIAIKVENLSKMYRLGDIGTGSLGTDITSWWAKVRGKEDPFSQIAIANDRSQKATSDFVWSLKDLNFEIKKGDALGIVGRNGAGKSTLLKILSRTTSPTTGNIKVNGRIASLLEVGTGFHGDLSGKENIYMNGAILGMTRKEITSKLEEIIEFSGVSGYIDTPVKRYSSGMYVRLAFAVAAHLDPDIMIIDEVLAVGDQEFQRKCINKMRDVNSEQGRTIIFVTHTMAAVRQLCSTVIFLKNGELIFNGEANTGIAMYLERESDQKISLVLLKPKDSEGYFSEIKIADENGNPINKAGYADNFYVFLKIVVNSDLEGAEVSVSLKNSNGINIIFTSLSESLNHELINLKKGTYQYKIKIEGNQLIPDNYYLNVFLHYRNQRNIDHHEEILKFNIEETGSHMAPYGTAASQLASVFGRTKWELKEKENAI
ncbi:MAG: ABC transporter ATP-binding protein [Bacteroidia bacterium]|nr:ABC transporter ATP-binding protein [Bacteroidia bacterium]